MLTSVRTEKQHPSKTNDANDVPFEQARLEALETGFLLACYQTLLIALRDRRLSFKHRAVLAVMIEHMNGKTGVTWIGRDRIAAELGLASKTVSNAIYELMAFGYILAENRRTPETNNRSLRHYTLRKLSRDEIARLITDTIEAIKASGPTSKVPAGGESESPHRRGSPASKSPPVGFESPRRRGAVTNEEKLTSEVLAERSKTRAAARSSPQPIDGRPHPARARTGKRPWDWVHEGEKCALLDRCAEYARARGWPREFLVERLKAFAAYQSSRRIMSADWWAELELWLGSRPHQPRAGNNRASTEDLAIQAFGGMPWERF
jgi:hypothetical protein